MSAIVPQPRIPITIRPATLSDLPFIDSLQKMHTKMVGWMPTKTLEGKINAGNVLIAVGARPASPSAEEGDAGSPPAMREPAPTGYVISQDRYFKHDDVGIIYQLNVVPMKQRNLVGASLIKAVFDRAAYGCRLFCCWCAQDIAANHFWEACGFVPLAFRAGSEKKQRIHIFWCKRIREGDTTTPWWFPAETKGGAMMEDRLVFPIPPGTHWSDAKPIVLPRHTHEAKLIEDGGAGRATAKHVKPALTAVKKREPLCGGLKFQSPEAAEMKVEKPKRPKREKIRNDPKFVSAARELRDRYLECINADGDASLSHGGQGKYDVGRAIADASRQRRPLGALPAAA